MFGWELKNRLRSPTENLIWCKTSRYLFGNQIKFFSGKIERWIRVNLHLQVVEQVPKITPKRHVLSSNTPRHFHTLIGKNIDEKLNGPSRNPFMDNIKLNFNNMYVVLYVYTYIPQLYCSYCGEGKDFLKLGFSFV